MLRIIWVLLLAGLVTGCGMTPSTQRVDLGLDGSAPVAGETLRAPRLPSSVSRLYAGGDLLWHDAQGRPTNDGNQLYAILAAAGGHGLRPDYYLPTDLLDAGSLPNTDRAGARVVDQALSWGLYHFGADLTYGRFRTGRPSPAPIFNDAVEASSLGVWMAKYEPQGRSYRDLRDRLRLGGLSAAQKSAIAINMERLGWVPEQPWTGPNIRVNVADAILEAYQGRRLVDTMRVVTGRESRQTPQLVDPIRDLKFSPDWTVPPTVIEEDFLPRLRANPNAFSRDEYEIRVNGRLATSSTRWTGVEAEDVLIRRASSAAGPLGGVRFSMYNRDAIFLHDTPARHYFDRSFRAYSSGCIRVQRAEDLAVWIMSTQGNSVSREEVQRRMNAGETSTITLDRQVEVSLQYMTAYVDGGGRLRFTQDPYSLDRPLARQMGLSIPTVRASSPRRLEYDISP